MLTTCRKLFEILFHGSYMRIIPGHLSGHVRDTCVKFLGINKCKFYMLATCRECFRMSNVSLSSTTVSGLDPSLSSTSWSKLYIHERYSIKLLQLNTVRTAKITDRTSVVSASNQAINYRLWPSLNLFENAKLPTSSLLTENGSGNF